MRELSPHDKLSGITFTLRDDALDYFSDQERGYKSYDEAIEGIRTWYTPDKKKSRSLHDWHTINLSNSMANYPNKSEQEVFRTLSSTLVATKGSLKTNIMMTYYFDTGF